MHKDRFKTKTPDDIVSCAEVLCQIFDIVKDQLLQHEREAIIQKYCYDKNTVEMADSMGINRRSVSCYLCTGLKKIRKYARAKLSSNTY